MEHSFLPIFMNMPSPTEEEQLEAMGAAQERYASNGYTTAQDAPMEPPTRPLYHKAAERGLLYIDFVGYVNWLEFAHILEQRSEAFGAPYENRFRVAGVKVIGDGSPQGKTAFWSEPLLTPGPAGEKDWRGEPNILPEDLNKIVKLAYDNKVQILIHAGGDATIDMILDAHRGGRCAAGTGARRSCTRISFGATNWTSMPNTICSRRSSPTICFSGETFTLRIPAKIVRIS